MTRTPTEHHIAEVAERSGFTAPTLRYYEQIGLMAPTRRTEAGYRVYDDQAVERLRFISRAKQLGCTLNEIADLATIWDDKECGPVQHRLRALVGAKISEAETRMAELRAFTSDLRATAALLTSSVDGPCDDTCGCSVVPGSAGSEEPRLDAGQLGAEPRAAESPPVACSLGAGAMETRLDEWRLLLEQVVGRESLADGIRLAFGPGAPLDEMARLAAAEHDCCGFFAFAITVDERGVALEVTAPAGGQDLIATLFGDGG
ncbi:MAG: MerR family transcriptional regulator [Acidimicrobiia bacterium]|nr:MerR family transcriptional regulator [Acidimicrobiia bacterium]